MWWRQESFRVWKNKEESEERPTEQCLKIKYKAPFLNKYFHDGEHDLVAQVKKKERKKLGYLHLNKTKKQIFNVP